MTKHPDSLPAGYPTPDSAMVDRLEALANSTLQRFLTMLRDAAPDPRLSYQRYRLLAQIQSAGQLAIGDIAVSLRIARSTASEAIARLAEEGLVQKAVASKDGRSVVVSVTPLGRRLVVRRRKVLWDAYRAWLTRLSEEDQDAVLQAFEVLDQLTKRATRI